MDTRQLRAFCTVVERRSFSQAAERLGVTQPAVSLQVRALEKRLGLQLLDRSGRRVEPTEAGVRLYRGAQRLLSLEEDLVNELAEGVEGDLQGRSRSARRPARGASCSRACSATSPRSIRSSTSRSPSSTHRPSSSALPTGRSSSVSSAPRRSTAASTRTLLPRHLTLACPPDHPFAGRTVSLDELRGETLIVMQDGAGVRQLIEDELRRRAGVRLRDLGVRLELGLQESVTSAVRGGYGVTFISRLSIENDLAAGTLAEATVAGLELEREVLLVRAAGRSETRRPGNSSTSPGAACRDRAVGSSQAAGGGGGGRNRTALRDRERALALARRPARRMVERGAVGAGRGPRGRRRRARDRRRLGDRHREGGLGRVGVAARERPDDLLRRGVDDVLRRALVRPGDAGRRRRRTSRRDRLRRRADARPAPRRVGRHCAERARTLRRGVVRARPHGRGRRRRSRGHG